MVFIFERFSAFEFCFHGFNYFYGVFNVGDHHYYVRSPRYVEESDLLVGKWRLHKNACGLLKIQ